MSLKEKTLAVEQVAQQPQHEETLTKQAVSETFWDRAGSLIFVGGVPRAKSTFQPGIAPFLRFHVP